MEQPAKTEPERLRDNRKRQVAITVIAMFALTCLGRLMAPEVALFRELLPIAAALLGLVVKEALGGRSGSL